MAARFRPVRAVGVTLGALVILAVGVYGPATLLGPLPEASVDLTAAPTATTVTSIAPALPVDGASAIALAPNALLASAGTTDRLPMAGIAKLVTALVVLDAKPLSPGRQGPAIPITLDDYRSYIDNTNDGNTTVTVLPGESWTQREMLRAMLLGSSNNHADSLARWAYGSRAAYLDAASAWLLKHDLTATQVDDATGLSPESAGSAADLARLAALVMAEPVLAEIFTDSSEAVDARGIRNRMAYLPERGVTGLSRSYTDAAGVCLLFAATATVDTDALPYYGVLLGLDDWDGLDAAATALVDSAEQGVQRHDLIADGDVFATYRTAWGARANAVAMGGASELAWQPEPGAAPRVTTSAVRTAPRGEPVGTVTVDARSGPVILPLVLDRGLEPPGPGWRLLNPAPLITALIDSFGE